MTENEGMDTTNPSAEEPQTDVRVPTGHAVIQGYLKTLDASPGVYRMLNAKAEVLYVGKARNLKARVSNYSRPSPQHSGRIARMISETASMMFLTTRTETEALLLEQNLIKQLKPRYNVLLRDDKSFPNILIGKEHGYPQLKKHRGKRTEKGSYFGPFASAGAVNRTLNQLQKVFLLRNCSDSMFESRTRPCLLFQIKRCSAPCVGRVTPDQYAAQVQDAVERVISAAADGDRAQEHPRSLQGIRGPARTAPGGGCQVGVNTRARPPCSLAQADSISKNSAPVLVSHHRPPCQRKWKPPRRAASQISCNGGWVLMISLLPLGRLSSSRPPVRAPSMSITSSCSQRSTCCSMPASSWWARAWYSLSLRCASALAVLIPRIRACLRCRPF